jgi:hypothetical protein
MAIEKTIKLKLKTYLEDRGCWWFMPVSHGYGRSGIPDFIVCYKGVFIGIETKAPAGVPGPHQKRECASIDAAGGIAIITKDINDVKKVFEQIDNYVVDKKNVTS